MADDDFQNIRARVPTAVKDAFDEMLTARKISQQDAICGLMEWITTEEPLTQAMVLGQVPDTDRGELTKIVLTRLASRRKR